MTEQQSRQIASRARTRASIVINDLFPYRLLYRQGILLVSKPPSNYGLITFLGLAVRAASSYTTDSFCSVPLVGDNDT